MAVVLMAAFQMAAGDQATGAHAILKVKRVAHKAIGRLPIRAGGAASSFCSAKILCCALRCPSSRLHLST